MTSRFKLYPHQQEVLDKLTTGSVLCGGVGSGKSITSIAYYFTKECGGTLPSDSSNTFGEMKKPKDLYIITTARKRDTLEWDKEFAYFLLSRDRENSINNVRVTVDSWNNIKKYVDVKDAFFIFDEQRLVGSGTWVRSFLKIGKTNNWILLTATPGDTWMDYIPVFLANGYYKNRTQFLRTHVVYNNFTPYPKIERYLGTSQLERHRRAITVIMEYKTHTVHHDREIKTNYNPMEITMIFDQRWNIFEEKPIENINEVVHLLRKVVNSDPTRVAETKKLIQVNPRVIIFYNFNFELDILREMTKELGVPTAEWNGHKHESIPDTKEWVYLVQYTAGAEGWNCVLTDTIIFYSQNYSYKVMTQAKGRIDRLNTPYVDLYYYHLKSDAPIDMAIDTALKNKKTFNERAFIKSDLAWIT